MSYDIIAAIKTHKVIAICRKIYGEELMLLAEALEKGGIRLIEVTFDHNDPEAELKTARAVALLKSKFPGLSVGAGTVLTPRQVEIVCDNGAQFIVSPNASADVIKRTVELGLVSIPGAMTPTEILMAHDFGAHFVKLFPAAALGIPYLKSIRAPINHVDLIATGGIGAENLAPFLSAGCAGAGIGGSLCDKTLIASGQGAAITALAKQITDIAERAN